MRNPYPSFTKKDYNFMAGILHELYRDGMITTEGVTRFSEALMPTNDAYSCNKFVDAVFKQETGDA